MIRYLREVSLRRLKIFRRVYPFVFFDVQHILINQINNLGNNYHLLLTFSWTEKKINYLLSFQ